MTSFTRLIEPVQYPNVEYVEILVRAPPSGAPPFRVPASRKVAVLYSFVNDSLRSPSPVGERACPFLCPPLSATHSLIASTGYFCISSLRRRHRCPCSCASPFRPTPRTIPCTSMLSHGLFPCSAQCPEYCVEGPRPVLCPFPVSLSRSGNPCNSFLSSGHPAITSGVIDESTHPSSVSFAPTIFPSHFGHSFFGGLCLQRIDWQLVLFGRHYLLATFAVPERYWCAKYPVS